MRGCLVLAYDISSVFRATPHDLVLSIFEGLLAMPRGVDHLGQNLKAIPSAGVRCQSAQVQVTYTYVLTHTRSRYGLQY